MNMEKIYESPQIEVVEIEVEKGFALSADTGMGDTPSTPDAPGRRGEWGDLW